MTNGLNPPVLHTTQDSEVLKLLKTIDTRLADVPSQFVKQEKKKKTPVKERKSKELVELENQLNSFTNFIRKDLKKSTVGLSIKDLSKYAEVQSKGFEKFTDTLEESLESYRDEILSSNKELTEKDKKNLSQLSAIEKKFRAISPKTAEDPLRELKDSIASFVTPVDKGVDVQGLTGKQQKDYLKQINQVSQKQAEEISESLKTTRDAILSKASLTDEDKQSLKEIDNFKIALKEYGIEDTTRTQKWLSPKMEAIQASMKGGTTDLLEATGKAILGPLNLITQPLLDVFGPSFKEIFGFGDKDKDEFTKKGKRIKPRRSDILKSNPEIVYLADQQKKLALEAPQGDKAGGVGGAAGNILTEAAGEVLGNTAAPILGKAAKVGAKILPAAAAVAVPVAAIGAGLAASYLALKYAGEKNQESQIAESDTRRKEAGVGKEDIVNEDFINKSKKGKIKLVDEAQIGDYTSGGYYIWQNKKGIFASRDLNTAAEISGSLGTDQINKLMNTYAKNSGDTAVAKFDDKQKQLELLSMLASAEKGNKLLKFHTGGIVPGKPNQEVPAILQAGEKVLTKKQQEFDTNDMQLNLSTIAKSFEQSSKGSEIVQNLKLVVDAINKKPFNNIVSNSSSATIDFNKLRGALS